MKTVYRAIMNGGNLHFMDNLLCDHSGFIDRFKAGDVDFWWCYTANGYTDITSFNLMNENTYHVHSEGDKIYIEKTS